MIKNLITFLIIIFLGSSSSYSLECLTCEKNKNIFDYSFSILNYINHQVCSSELIPFKLKSPLTFEQRCQLIKDLEILRNLEFKKYGAKFEKIFTPSLPPEKAGEEIYNWLLNRISNIYLINSNVSTAINYGLCQETGICDYNYKRGDIGLDDSYFNKKTPLERILVLIHEARHTDGHDFLTGKNLELTNYDTLHISCDSFNVSTSGRTDYDEHKTCDDNLDGSIGTSLIVTGNLLLNCHECNDLVNFGDEELNSFYIRNIYNNQLRSINNLEINSTNPFN